MEHAFDSEALEWFSRRTDPTTLVDRHWAAPDWGASLEALSWVFALDRDEHFLKRPPGVLPRLWERQVTSALGAVLLNDPSKELDRCQALFDALEGRGRVRLAHIDRIAADDASRMDLAIHVIAEGGARHCLVIEAKFEFELSDRQLAKYRDALRTAYPRMDQRHLWVVAPARTRRTQIVLGRRENAEWRFASWRRVLLAWQRMLPDEPGTDLLSLFSEIWKRSGGN